MEVKSSHNLRWNVEAILNDQLKLIIKTWENANIIYNTTPSIALGAAVEARNASWEKAEILKFRVQYSWPFLMMYKAYYIRKSVLFLKHSV